MPRTLPWLENKAARKADTTPRSSRKRSFSPASNLVTSDLDAIPRSATSRPANGKRPRARRSPSTSPPPAPPDAEFMEDGFDADDIFMMVEDEFDATARLFTQHIHHAEYQRLKKLHRSRGAETLASLGHGTDGRTDPSRAIRVQMEAQEKAKKGKSESLEDGESEDEWMLDPQLAGLMTASRRVGSKQTLDGLAKAKSDTRAAAGFSQSPYRATRTRDALREESSSSPLLSGEVNEGRTHDDWDDDQDDDDLDAPSRRFDTLKSKERVRPRDGKTEPILKDVRIFKAFARSMDKDPGLFKTPLKQSRQRSPSPVVHNFGDGRVPTPTGCVNGSGNEIRESERSTRVAKILEERRRRTQGSTSTKQESSPSPKKLEDPTNLNARKNLQDLGLDSSIQRKIDGRTRKTDEKRTTKTGEIPTFLF